MADFADRVKETTTTTGTGSLTLLGAATGYQSFTSQFANASRCYYAVPPSGGAEWEVGYGTMSSPTVLARTSVLASSNGGAAVNFSAGTKDVFNDVPASWLLTRATAATTLAGYGITDAQALSAYLTTISGLTPSNDDLLQFKAGAWANRTLAQLKTDLAAFRADAYYGTTGSLASTYDRATLSSLAAGGAPTSGTLRLMRIILPAGLTVSNITWFSGSTALSVGVNQWFALFDASRNKLAISADDGANAWAANAPKTLAMTTPYLVPASGLYYIGYCVVATTVPTFESVAGAMLTTGARNTNPIVGGNSTGSLNGPGTCPATAGAISPLAQFSYGEVS